MCVYICVYMHIYICVYMCLCVCRGEGHNRIAGSKYEACV